MKGFTLIGKISDVRGAMKHLESKPVAEIIENAGKYMEMFKLFNIKFKASMGNEEKVSGAPLTSI